MLDVNQTAPDFSLPQLNDGDVHLYEEAKGDSILVFYKHTCGTSRFALPFLERIYRTYGDSIFFAAIAQDEADVTKQLKDELEITIPILLDKDPYPVSRAYGLHTVPSIFLIAPDKKIRLATYGFVKQDLLNLADIVAEKTGRPQMDLFESADVPEIKPG